LPERFFYRLVKGDFSRKTNDLELAIGSQKSTQARNASGLAPQFVTVSNDALDFFHQSIVAVLYLLVPGEEGDYSHEFSVGSLYFRLINQ
jgi:hypothetical protein